MWEPISFGAIHIFPMAKVFFIAKFENAQNRKLILCNHSLAWKNYFALMVKLWHPNFSPSSEHFSKFLISVTLTYLPLHHWVDSLLEAIGNALGDFLMVGDESSNIMHSTYARILVGMYIFKGFLEMIKLDNFKGYWIQTLDYEGLPFRCRKCSKRGHLAAHCGLEG